MKFFKYHGLGNDFVVLDAEVLPAEFSGQMARTLCDRHFGIGADGVLVVKQAPREGLQGQMIVYNSDGSQAEMCGNGIRCVAYHLLRHHRVGLKELAILTGAGVKTCTIFGRHDDGLAVQVAMGTIAFTAEDLPPIDEQGRARLTLEDGSFHSCYPASAGNPHAVIRVEDEEDPMSLAKTVGPLLESHPAFPRKTNVEFVKRLADDLYEVAVYERGSGITMACGSGATSVAAVAMQYWGAPDTLKLQLPGGILGFQRERDGQMLMTGPAMFVYEGEWQW